MMFGTMTPPKPIVSREGICLYVLKVPGGYAWHLLDGETVLIEYVKFASEGFDAVNSGRQFIFKGVRVRRNEPMGTVIVGTLDKDVAAFDYREWLNGHLEARRAPAPPRAEPRRQTSADGSDLPPEQRRSLQGH